jgi:hypothetical protein
MMQRLHLLTLALAALVGTPAAAQEVPLSYAFRPFHGPPGYSMGQPLQTADAPPAKLVKTPRLQSTRPLSATARLGRGGDTTFTFLFDESRGTGRGYDRLYVDANQNRDLTDDRPVRGFYRRGAMVFGPLPLRIPVDGQRRLYHAVVEGRERGPNREYVLRSLGYYTGAVPFGSKRCPVALVDANANGLYGDPFRGFSPDPEQFGDMLLVDANKDGRFDPGGMIPREMLFCGKCIVVDGRFYELALRPDGSGMRVTPAPVKLATLRSGYPRFGIMLLNDKGVLPLESHNGVIRVPPGQYRVLRWSLDHPTREGKWEVQGGAMGEGEGPQLVVPEDGAASFQLTTPLLAKVTASPVTPGSLDFQLSLTTSSGETIANIAVNGQRPPEPTLKLLDEGGNEVATLKFHYG